MAAFTTPVDAPATGNFARSGYNIVSRPSGPISSSGSSSTSAPRKQLSKSGCSGDN
ncbi:hypothetical protein PT974_07114 [Cladobotryum mycophilum]|uniref:Uncharacterized protein n=1 Tax=Cladobotryum mycophilum TaxID=491253 RepID=A0ABR0SNJ6_9HYPO